MYAAHMLQYYEIMQMELDWGSPSTAILIRIQLQFHIFDKECANNIRDTKTAHIANTIPF